MLRNILGQSYCLAEKTFNTTQEISEFPLVEDCIYQIHQIYNEQFAYWLARKKFKTVALIRHPLDTLLSQIKFSSRGPNVKCWWTDKIIIRESGNDPAADKFKKYLTSDLASELLSVSPSWWDVADYRLKYEDVLDNPDYVYSIFGEPKRHLGNEEIDSFKKNLASFQRSYIWTGAAGHWSNIIDAETAQAVYEKNLDAFACGRYTIDQARELTDEQIRSAWEAPAQS